MPRAWLAFSVLLCSSSLLQAQSVQGRPAQGAQMQWLADMTRSFMQLDYDGVLVSNRGGQMRSVRIVHVVRDGMESERLQYLDGEPLEIVRTAHPADCVHTGSQIVLSSAGSKLFGSYQNAGQALKGLYRVQAGGQSRVAGRAVKVLAVKPTDPHRYSHRLFLDGSTRLLLKSEVLDQQGNVLESSQFTQIKIGDAVDPDAIQSVGERVVREGFHGVSAQHGAAQKIDWRLGWMPAGFMPAGQGEYPVLKTDSMAQARHYTDGIAQFSVFAEHSEEAVQVFQSRKGSTLAYVAPKQIHNQWRLITVVGELPLATAIKIVQNIQARAEAGHD